MTFSNKDNTDLFNVGEKLKRILFPFYKGITEDEGSPDFRRRIDPDDAEQLFQQLHELIIEIDQKDQENGTVST